MHEQTRSSRQSRQTRALSFCQDKPDKYKLCAQHICVPVHMSCPCREMEHFRCSDGRCLRPDFLCDGYRDCADGRDEDVCHRESDQSSLPLVVGVGVGSVVAIAVVITLVTFFLRRRKHQFLKNEPACKPLQNGSSTSDPSSLDIVPHPTRYTAVSKYDNFTNFDDVLCTSTPRPDSRRLVNPGHTQNKKPKTDEIIQTKVI